MDRSGIDRAVLQGWYWEHQETCDALNRYYAGCLKTHPDRISAFASVNPSAGESALDAIRRARDEGFSGLGELCPGVQGGHLRDPKWVEAMTLAAEFELVVLFHVDELVGRDHPGRVQTPPEDFRWILEACSNLRIILAHFGGGLVFHRLNRGVRKPFERIWFDTAASPLLYDSRVYAAAITCGAGDRLLFGSDFPLITFPHQSGLSPMVSGKGRGRPDLLAPLNEIREAGLSETDLDRILAQNAADLLGIQRK
jgi:predicted TIM-barrel fold metal-dependent hydrolase